MARALIGLGALLIALGCIAWLMERAGLHPGRLPGDLSFGSGNVRVYVPIVTSVLLSVLLTLALLLFGAAKR